VSRIIIDGKGSKEQAVISTNIKAMLPAPSVDNLKTLPREADRDKPLESANVRSMIRVVEGTVRVMKQMMEFRDPYTAGHQSRVSRICVEISKIMGLSDFRIKGIELAAFVHDVGKLSVPFEILNKPGQLTKSEFETIKTHPAVGYDIINIVEFPWPVAQSVLQHHERMNGSGYPNGLSGQDILLESRILAVADVVDAMSSNRPYRPALGIHLALEEICLNKYRLYDGDVVDAAMAYYATHKAEEIPPVSFITTKKDN
jgi:HD-GYP domain-containing protein (c-di-GMP phosphodiesterase class II)